MRTGMVQRPAELRAVDELLRAAASEPAGLVLTGDAGIGKTTVWLNGLERATAAGYRVLSTRIAATETVLAYAGLAALLDTVTEHALDSLPPPQRLAIDRVLLNVGAEGPPTDQRAVTAAVASILAVLAADAPVLVAIDDLQWLDAPSMQVVSAVTRRLRGAVAVLATVRSGPVSAKLGTWLELPRPDRMQWMTLSPLSVGALHAVLSQRLGRSFSRPKLLQIHQTSGGNPFYAVELARAAGTGGWDPEADLPATLAELVQLRIGQLGADARTALLAVSALANPTVELVAEATETSAPAVVALLEDAEAQGIIAIEGNRLRFTHPLLARGVYSASGPARRRRMHRRLAELLAEPELRARHLALASSAGDQQTLSSLDTAAHSARQRGAPAHAAELLELAMGLGGDPPERRLMSAANQFDAGELAEAKDQLRRLIDVLDAGQLRTEALKLLAVVRIHDDSFAEAAGLLEHALDECEDPSSRVQMLVMLSYAQFNRGETAPAMSRIEEAVSTAEDIGRADLISQALGMRPPCGSSRARGSTRKASREQGIWTTATSRFRSRPGFGSSTPYCRPGRDTCGRPMPS